MKQFSLSILIPFYNVEPYFERCIRSLMGQTIKERVEYVFIDDGSLDRSYEVLTQTLAEYPEKSECVKILRHKQNLGIAATKTDCIRQAQGEYICWCDADDWCEPNMFEMLYNTAIQSGADIVACNHYFEEKGNRIEGISLYSNNKQDVLEYLYCRKDYFFPLWDTIMRRSLLTDHEILPYPGVNIAEDVNVALRAIYYANRVVKLPDFLYHYNKDNINSMTLREYDDLDSRWQQNQKNTNSLCAFFLSKDPRRFKTMCNYLKFSMKVHNSIAIGTPEQFFNTYKESHHQILSYRSFPLSLRIKWWIIYFNEITFKLYGYYSRLRG